MGNEARWTNIALIFFVLAATIFVSSLLHGC
jgi:hypothetical protein